MAKTGNACFYKIDTVKYLVDAGLTLGWPLAEVLTALSTLDPIQCRGAQRSKMPPWGRLWLNFGAYWSVGIQTDKHNPSNNPDSPTRLWPQAGQKDFLGAGSLSSENSIFGVGDMRRTALKFESTFGRYLEDARLTIGQPLADVLTTLSTLG